MFFKVWGNAKVHMSIFLYMLPWNTLDMDYWVRFGLLFFFSFFFFFWGGESWLGLDFEDCCNLQDWIGLDCL